MTRLFGAMTAYRGIRLGVNLGASRPWYLPNRRSISTSPAGASCNTRLKASFVRWALRNALGCRDNFITRLRPGPRLGDAR
jgi:hypothetical protein